MIIEERYLAEFMTVAIIHFLAVASPGPDFAVVLRQSVARGRAAGIWTSLGIGAGIFLHVAYCVLGLGIVISKSIVVFNIIKYAGAAYLIYLGLRAVAVKAAAADKPGVQPEVRNTQVSARDSFITGFITNALNPKATLFFLAVFSVTVSPETPPVVQACYGAWMAFASAAWFGALTMLFSNYSVRNVFLRFGHWFERSMGAVLVALGLKIALSPAR